MSQFRPDRPTAARLRREVDQLLNEAPSTIQMCLAADPWIATTAIFVAEENIVSTGYTKFYDDLLEDWVVGIELASPRSVGLYDSDSTNLNEIRYIAQCITGCSTDIVDSPKK